MSQARAGAVAVDITPGAGLSMGGYGARTGVAERTHDPLQARVLVLDDGDSQLVVAVCDLLGVGRDLVAETRRMIEDDTGIPPQHVLVAATHTHSGPAGFRISDAADFVGVTARKIAGAVRTARRDLCPVTLKVAEAEVRTISQNRRHPDGPIQPIATVLSALPDGGAPPVATLVNFACHSTVLEHDNLEYSADFPGAMARAVEQAVGGTAIYLQGAAGDINPVWMRHDHTDVARVGGILGAAAARAVHELRPLGEGQWCINLNWSEEIEHPAAPGSVLTDVRLAGMSRVLDLERRPRRDPAELAVEIEQLTEERQQLPDGDVDRRRQLTARINEPTIAHTITAAAERRGGGNPSQQLEVQALRISAECAIVTLPGEFFVETGHDIAARSGLRHPLIAGYANGSVGYVPTAAAFNDAGYEVGMAQFGPGAAEVIADAAVSLLGELYRR